MSNAEAAVDADLKTKSLLVISSPSPTKRHIFQRLKATGVKVTLVSSENSWASRYADHFLSVDTKDQAETLAEVEAYVKENKIDGVLTFWENAVPLAAALAEKFGWVGHTPQAALSARNKLLTRKTIDTHKLSRYSPAWAQVKSAKDLERESKRIGFPLVLKPAWGVKSQFVVRVDSLEEAKNAF